MKPQIPEHDFYPLLYGFCGITHLMILGRELITKFCAFTVVIADVMKTDGPYYLVWVFLSEAVKTNGFLANS